MVYEVFCFVVCGVLEIEVMIDVDVGVVVVVRDG